ncbi:helix-turn-helix transcriptional regulator [Microbacterium sp. zg.Y625]|uniref:winged helix-turn-helix transcriptional regulator n=1 Tax=Microbacterium jiangjiandongii TaxID=3049071 RepID=UPI00214AB89C|nr:MULTISPECIES: helix-turn-helix domain-containing protein [unclassified Microbacterium]MCR2793350.1 helix-turn-helix transcriptional regulator [Microbacterium sp. zg.Y625]WIM25275.1 helix-turn-helix domain-containing protein [Microbacterium sp. zg-Y625]
MAARSYGQYCGVTTAVELIGERWALLIVRDLLVGPRRYTDLKAGLPRIPTNILAARLKELQDAGVVRRVPLSHRGLVYDLTPYGRELEPIVLALGRWGFAAMGEPEPDDVVTADSLTMALRTAFRPDAAAALPATGYDLHVGDVGLRARVDGVALAVRRLDAGVAGGAGDAGLAATADAGADEPAADAVIVAGPGIRGIISGELAPADALARGVVRVPRGDAALLGRFATTFHIAPAAAAA